MKNPRKKVKRKMLKYLHGNDFIRIFTLYLVGGQRNDPLETYSR
jgi:hypothetical protein